MLYNNNIRLGNIFEMRCIVYFSQHKKIYIYMLPGIKLGTHDISNVQLIWHLSYVNVQWAE